MRTAAILCLTALVACGGRTASTSGSDDEATGSGGDESDTRGGEDLPGGDGCEDRDPNVFSSFWLEGYEDDEDIDLDLQCTIYGVADLDDEGYLIQLTNCMDWEGVGVGELELRIHSEPGVEPFLSGGSDARFRYIQTPPFFAGRWFSLRPLPGEGLALGGFSGQNIFPPVDDFDFDPVQMAIATAGCGLVDDPSGCALAERLLLDVEFDGQSVGIHDGQANYVGQLTSYLVIVDSLVQHHELTCMNFPISHYEVLLISIPEG